MHKTRRWLLGGMVAVALFFRTWNLGGVGLSEDEANKILAVKSYRQGDFNPNSEHPMLMKLLCTGSIVAVEQMNGSFGTRISHEAALRFPVALIGSLTTIPIYLLGAELLNPATGLIAAVLWATDINSIALTRIAKEDPLVAFFFLLGSLSLLRGKRFHFENREKANRCYIASGAFFGLLFASKYLVPILWLPLIYYDVFRFGKAPLWRIDRRTWIKILLAFVIALLLCDPIILSPEMWSYAWSHFKHKRLAHNGYMFLDQLELNKTYYTFWGTPPYFYPLYLFVKTPVLLFALLCTGLWFTLRRIRDSRFFFLGLYFLLWLFLLTLPGGKFTRYVITLLPAVVLLEALGIYIVFSMIRAHVEKRSGSGAIAGVVLGILIACTAGWMTMLNFLHHPHYSLYVAEQAGGKAKRGFYFPQDDFYDAGLREAIAWISREAPPNTEVLGSTPSVFEYYTSVFRRPDLRFQSTVDPAHKFSRDEKPYVLYQYYRTYLENRYLMTFFHAELRPQHEVRALDQTAVTVYRICREESCARAPFWKGRWYGRLKGLGEENSGFRNADCGF